MPSPIGGAVTFRKLCGASFLSCSVLAHSDRCWCWAVSAGVSAFEFERKGEYYPGLPILISVPLFSALHNGVLDEVVHALPLASE